MLFCFKTRLNQVTEADEKQIHLCILGDRWACYRLILRAELPQMCHHVMKCRSEWTLAQTVFLSIAYNYQWWVTLLHPNTWLMGGYSEKKKILMSCDSNSPWTENPHNTLPQNSILLCAPITWNCSLVTYILSELFTVERQQEVLAGIFHWEHRPRAHISVPFAIILQWAELCIQRCRAVLPWDTPKD